jgi:phage terminase large subunit-like protein
MTAATLRDLLPGLPPRRVDFNPWHHALSGIASVGTANGNPWHDQRRPAQVPPDWPWQVWLLMAGRGFGKTRTGAEWAREQVMFGNRRIGHFIAPTAADARDVMIEGPAGFLKVCEPYGWMPKYEPSKRRITCPNGATIHVFSAEEPERLRGPQCDFLWADEIGTWKNALYVWDMAMFGLRLGTNPQALATTTPRPTALVKALVADQWNPIANPDGGVAITGGSTYENAANLAKTFLSKIVKKYRGTRLGDQELFGKLLLDMPGALWSASLIEQFRITIDEDNPNPPIRDMDLYKVAVGVDPMTKDPKTEDDVDNPAETGIIVAGLGPREEGYVLEDASQPGTPYEWGTAAVRMARKWRADHIVAEANNGGMMVKHTIQSIDPTIPVVLVHASRGKITRAEPVSSMYEQGRVHHVGQFPKLEDQMTTFTGKPGEHSPDRMDAAVWVLTDLMIGLAAGEIDPYTEEAFDWTLSA